MPAYVKMIGHVLHFKSVNTLWSIPKKGGDAIRAFTQAAIAQESITGPVNTAHVAAADTIGPTFKGLISRSAKTMREKKQENPHSIMRSFYF